MVSPTPFRAAEFKSAYGPKYTYQPNVFGLSGRSLMRLGVQSGAYGGAAVAAALLFAAGIPRINEDILLKIPIPFIQNYFTKSIHPADNAF